jgi:biotin carboxyl carrier protein
MSGVVAGIFVKQGQSVNEGDRIVELEAMKMKVPVVATRAGNVAQILVAVGDGVEKGQVLISLA